MEGPDALRKKALEAQGKVTVVDRMEAVMKDVYSIMYAAASRGCLTVVIRPYFVVLDATQPRVWDLNPHEVNMVRKLLVVGGYAVDWSEDYQNLLVGW